MSTIFTRRTALVAAATTALATAACSAGSSGDQPSVDPSAKGSELPTVEKGKLTIATGQPAYSPWVENDNPASGEGFEAAVAYAVAQELGFSQDQVTWTRSTFDAAIAPGAKDWDFNVQQFSITEERRNAVDFSSPYYVTAQAVVALKNSPAASATTLADLTSVAFGVQSGVTGQRTLTTTITPDKEPAVFNSSQDVVQALKSGQVDAIVVDLPTAIYLVGAELDDGMLVGQFADTQGGEELALVLPKSSALTAPVTAAVDRLRAAGTLDELAKKWLSDSIHAPVLS